MKKGASAPSSSEYSKKWQPRHIGKARYRCMADACTRECRAVKGGLFLRPLDFAQEECQALFLREQRCSAHGSSGR